ncbi:MAG: hypothetical protein KAH84_07390 [Thiomargarita sp.]|nr:hypothetical protein [Thiomargarita sp.]
MLINKILTNLIFLLLFSNVYGLNTPNSILNVNTPIATTEVNSQSEEKSEQAEKLEPQNNISAKTEVELVNLSPTVKSVSLQMRGTERETVAIDTLEGIVKDILHNTKLSVVRLITVRNIDSEPELITKVVQKIEIIVFVKTSLDVESQVYDIRVILQESANQIIDIHNFQYIMEQPDKIYNELKQYFTEKLNLQTIKMYFPPTGEKTIAKPVTLPILKKLPVEVVTPVIKTETTAIVEALNKTTDKDSLVEDPFVSEKTEIQLKNMTATVKSVSIKLKGSEREQELLNKISLSVQEMLNTSRLGVVRIPIFEDPTSTPVIKVSEHLEIIIGAKSPKEEGLAYQVTITLREKNTSGGQSYILEYQAIEAENFFYKLKTFLTEQLHLQPK